MSFLGSLVSGVFGLFGSKKQKQADNQPQIVKNEVDYGKMVADSSAAGFNPLTAIRNGGAAGFTTTTSSPTISQSPNVLANLGGILGDALSEQLDPINAKRREVDTLLVDRQLRQLKEGPQIPASFKPARLFSGTKVSRQLVPRLGAVSSNRTASVPAALIRPNYETESAKRVQYGDDTGWQANPWMPSADTIEQDFGDVAGSLYGIPKILGDLAWNGYRVKDWVVDKFDQSAGRERRAPKQRYSAPKRLGGWAGRAPKVISGGGGGW